MDRKTLAKYIILALIAAAIRFGCGFFADTASDIIAGPVIGIFMGIPGIIGFSIGCFLSELVQGTIIDSSLLFMIPAAVSALLPFLGRRFLKDKSKFTYTCIYFAITAISSIVLALIWTVLFLVTEDIGVFGDLFIDYLTAFCCISFSASYPLYFLVSAIKERNFKTGNPLLNAYVCWLPLQLFFTLLFAAKVYTVSSNTGTFLDAYLFDDWSLIHIYLLAMDIALLLFAILTKRFKRVMLFIVAAFIVSAAVYNIIHFDTGEGVYILIFLGLWLLLHAFFFSWYDNKALKIKGIKITTIVLHCVFLITFVLVSALDISVYIIPRANGDEKNVVVLGAPVYDNKASDILEDRISLASDYLNINEKADAILTGGTKVEGGKTEAEVIRDGLVKNGISESRLTLESDAKTTQENFERSLEIVKQKGGTADDEIVIITSAFHLLRSGIYARRAGFNNLTYAGAYSHYFKELGWYIREAFSILPLLFS